MAVVILHVHKYIKKKITRTFKSGGQHENHVVATWEPSQHSLVDTGAFACRCRYIYKTKLASNEMFSLSNKIHWEVGRAKDLSAPRYFKGRFLF